MTRINHFLAWFFGALVSGCDVRIPDPSTAPQQPAMDQETISRSFGPEMKFD